MSEAKAAFLFNVWDGDNGFHPHQDRFLGVANTITALNERGVSVDVLYGEQAPQPGNVQPKVHVCRDFAYDEYDKFVLGNTGWEDNADDLQKYDLIIDQGYRWMHYTPDPLRPDYFVSPGIGMPPSHVVNSWLSHEFGNNKTLADQKLLVPNKAGLPTYTIDQLEMITDGPMFAKPVSGSCGRDLKRPNGRDELRQLIKNGQITADYQIQPLIDETLPIRGLVAYYPEQQAEIDALNNDRERVKERRHHVFTTEIDNIVDFQLFSTLRVGKQGARQMGRADSKWMALSPESLPKSSEWHGTLISIARSLHKEMSLKADGSPVHSMIAIDDADAGFPNGEQKPVVIEVNTRFAGIPREAVLAQKALPGFLASIALANATPRG